MHKKLFLASALLTTINLYSENDILTHLKNQVQDALTGPFAIHVYKGVAVGTGLYIAKQIVDPLFYKCKEKINLLSPQEERSLFLLRKEISAFNKQEFELNANKRAILQSEFPDYKEYVESEIEETKKSDLPESEKQQKINTLQIQLRSIEAKLRLVQIMSYNKMFNSTTF